MLVYTDDSVSSGHDDLPNDVFRGVFFFEVTKFRYFGVIVMDFEVEILSNGQI